MSWQLMDTAPSDGTYILLFEPRKTHLPHGANIGIGCFSLSKNGWRTWGPGTVANPTAWMSLPPPVLLGAYQNHEGDIAA